MCESYIQLGGGFRMTVITTVLPNIPAPGQAEIASLLPLAHHRLGLPEPERWRMCPLPPETDWTASQNSPRATGTRRLPPARTVSPWL